MKKWLDKGFIQTKEETFLNLVIIIAPLLNFLSGINIDLYTPSLPAIAHYFDASITSVKNTITVSMIGFAIGCLIFGAAMDVLGRRRIILFGLVSYTIANFLVLFATNIEELLLLRFIQGLMVSTVSIGSRALIIDNFTGHRFIVGLLYTSIAFSLGPILGPFIGGILQYHFGWQANFLAYGWLAMALFIIFALYVNEAPIKRQQFSLKTILSNYLSVMKHRTFMAGVIIAGGGQFELLLYPTVGSFLVENILHRTPIAYGNSALIISCGYLLGSLVNRLLIKRLDFYRLIHIGFASLILGLLLQISFALLGNFNLFTLVLPIVIVGFGNGFIFSNILARSLKVFQNYAGVATAVLICLLMAIAAIGVFIVSHINVANLMTLSILFGASIAIRLLVYFIIFKRTGDEQ
jgi:MFS family permease